MVLRLVLSSVDTLEIGADHIEGSTTGLKKVSSTHVPISEITKNTFLKDIKLTSLDEDILILIL